MHPEDVTVVRSPTVNRHISIQRCASARTRSAHSALISTVGVTCAVASIRFADRQKGRFSSRSRPAKRRTQYSQDEPAGRLCAMVVAACIRDSDASSALGLRAQRLERAGLAVVVVDMAWMG